MALVDLRGRQEEPDVAELIALGAGTPVSAERARAHYADGSWILVGWSEDGALVGCAGVERLSETEIALHTVAVAERSQARGHGRVMVDAIAAVATADRIVAETDADAVGFYRRCGFTTSSIEHTSGRERYACIRRIVVEPAPESGEPVLTLAELERAIRAGWGRDTSDDPDEWSEDNPARGQCATTALVVRGLLGGEILVAGVVREGKRVERHAWNRLPSGVEIDLTRDQFRQGELFETPVVDEPILTHGHAERYETLHARVGAALRPPTT